MNILIRNAIAASLLLLLGLPSTSVAELLKQISLNGSESLISKEAQFDKGISSDGDGSFKVIATRPTTIELLAIPLSDIDDAKLLFGAQIKTEDLSAPAYLEMWLNFPGQGEFFSKGLQDPVKETTDWVNKKIPFMLQKGQKPDRIRLNVVMQGAGTIWIDDIRIEKVSR